jgi:hypothetical protein
MFKSLKAKIQHKRSRSSSRMADESERSREADPPESEEISEPIEVKPEVRPAEGDVVKVEGDGQEEEGKQTKRAILGEYLYLSLPFLSLSCFLHLSMYLSHYIYLYINFHLLRKIPLITKQSKLTPRSPRPLEKTRRMGQRKSPLK